MKVVYLEVVEDWTYTIVKSVYTVFNVKCKEETVHTKAICAKLYVNIISIFMLHIYRDLNAL